MFLVVGLNALLKGLKSSNSKVSSWSWRPDVLKSTDALNFNGAQGLQKAKWEMTTMKLTFYYDLYYVHKNKIAFVLYTDV